MSGRERHGVFISYARQDGEAAARALHARLAADAPDLSTWLDRNDVEGGVGWWTQIEQQLDRAEFLILVMTPAALRSENTRREWRSARQRGVCVYPVVATSGDGIDYDALPRWMSKAHFYNPASEWEKLIAHLRRGCRATRVPFMAPPLPASFVPRPRETEALMALLHARDAGAPVAITTALRGAGGFGKTTLAAAVCHDDRIVDAFDDGILWVTLGQTPNLLNELVKLYAALCGERPPFVDVDDASRELAGKLEHKACLIVVDDVWHPAHLAPFLLGAEGCVRLITTRSYDVATEARRVDVDQMQPEEAVQLLVARSGAFVDAKEPFARLASRLGEWPLTITLAGSAMRQRIERGESAAKALEYVSRALDARGVTAFDRGQPASRQDAVARTIGASLDLLTAGEQQRCAELSIFPEDALIPLDAAAALWDLDPLTAEDLARRIDDVALVHFDLRTGTLRLHDVLRSFLAGRMDDKAAVHRRLVTNWGDLQTAGDRLSAAHAAYVWRHLGFHMRGAGLEQEWRNLLVEPPWLEGKLRAIGLHAVIADFEAARTNPDLAIVHDALRLAAPILATDPTQLCAQLFGRLLARTEPALIAYRERLQGAIARPWLRPLHPTLDSPGEMLLMTVAGHTGEVTSLADVPAAGRLASASNDGTVRVWNRATGDAVHTFYHHQHGARVVAASRDDGLILSGGADGRLYLWDAVSGEGRSAAFVDARVPAVLAAALSADGTIAISGSRDGVIRVWDVRQQSLGGTLVGHRDRITSLAMSADGSRAASASDDGTVRVWDVASRQLTSTLEGHTDSATAVAMSADGNRILSGSADRTVKLWDTHSGACVRTFTGHAGSVTSVALAGAAPRAISGSADKSALLWDLQSSDPLTRLEGHADAVTAVLIDDAGTQATTASVDRTIKLWRLDGLRRCAVAGVHAGDVTAIVFNGDGRLCASGGSDGQVIVREAATGRIVRAIAAHTATVRSLAFSEDSTCVLSAGLDSQHWLWTVEEGAATWIPVRHQAPVDTVAFTSPARYLTTACADRFVYFWDVPSGALVERFGTRRLFDHLITPSPHRAAVGNVEEFQDQYLPGESVFDVVIVRVSADASHVVFSATGREVDHSTVRRRVTGSTAVRDGAVACLLTYSVATGEIHSVVVPQGEAIGAFAIEPAASLLVFARSSNRIEVWDLQQEKLVAVLGGHSEKINAVAVARDGRRAASCSRDRSVRVWDLQSATQIAALTFDSALRSVVFSPDAQTLAVGDVGGRVHLLRLETPSS